MKKSIALAGLLLGTAIAAPPAWAHGDAAKGKPAAVVKEQKPWGIAGDAQGARTIEVRMTDAMRFAPDRIEVREGETVRLVIRNAGKMLHELVIGTPQELAAHAELMLKHPGMEHDEPYMAHVSAGKRGQIVWNFNRPGTFQFACLIPGHFQAGMVGTVVVTPAASKGKTSLTRPSSPAAAWSPRWPPCPSAPRWRKRPPGCWSKSGKTPTAAAATTG
jgi:uncharacterized cupredoxin-like copper-binding protein